MTRLRTRFGAAAIAAALLGLCPVRAATLIASPLVAQTTQEGARLEYQNVPFAAENISADDSHFRLAGAGFPLRGGVRLISRDPTIYSISWINGLSSGMLRDGRGIVVWPGTSGHQPVTEVRIARTAELAGGATGRIGGTQQAPSHPDLAGYQYVTSERLFGAGDYLGLWRRAHGPEETLIVNFLPASGSDHGTHRVIGRLPLRLKSLYVYMALHGVSWDLVLTSEARVGRPIYILHYSWLPSYYQPLAERDRDNAGSR